MLFVILVCYFSQSSWPNLG